MEFGEWKPTRTPAAVPFEPCSPEHKGGLRAVQGRALLRDLRALGIFFLQQSQP